VHVLHEGKHSQKKLFAIFDAFTNLKNKNPPVFSAGLQLSLHDFMA